VVGRLTPMAAFLPWPDFKNGFLGFGGSIASKLS
jgi:hypothetical protein